MFLFLFDTKILLNLKHAKKIETYAQRPKCKSGPAERKNLRRNKKHTYFVSKETFFGGGGVARGP